MEEIFGKKPWVKPLCTLSSSSENNVDDEKATIADIVDEPCKFSLNKRINAHRHTHTHTHTHTHMHTHVYVYMYIYIYI